MEHKNRTVECRLLNTPQQIGADPRATCYLLNGLMERRLSVEGKKHLRLVLGREDRSGVQGKTPDWCSPQQKEPVPGVYRLLNTCRFPLVGDVLTHAQTCTSVGGSHRTAISGGMWTGGLTGALPVLRREAA